MRCVNPTNPSMSSSEPTPTVSADELTYVGVVETNVWSNEQTFHVVFQMEVHKVVVFGERLRNEHTHDFIVHVHLKKEPVSADRENHEAENACEDQPALDATLKRRQLGLALGTAFD